MILSIRLSTVDTGSPVSARCLRLFRREREFSGHLAHAHRIQLEFEQTWSAPNKSTSDRAVLPPPPALTMVNHGTARRRAVPVCSRSNVLIDENRVSAGVYRDEAGRTRRALVRLIHQLHALRLQLAL